MVKISHANCFTHIVGMPSTLPLPLFTRAYGHGSVNIMLLNTAVITIQQGDLKQKTSTILPRECVPLWVCKGR